MPQWAGSNRGSRLPADWPRIRNHIKKRDGYRCTEVLADGTRCPEPATDVDHIIPGDDHRDENLRSLCGWHHDKKSGSEGGRARAATLKKNAAKFRREEVHPGLL